MLHFILNCAIYYIKKEKANGYYEKITKRGGATSQGLIRAAFGRAMVWSSLSDLFSKSLDYKFKANYNSNMKKYSCGIKGFTLAEVLITLGIIGVVAALTIPTLISKYQETQFKAAYKKAYADLNQVLLQAFANNEIPYRTSRYSENSTQKEFDLIKKGFKVSKSCELDNFYECWSDGDTLCGGECSPDVENGLPTPTLSRWAFVDLAGRAWAPYSRNENIYLVDTNGSSKPNIFGQDRWIFTFVDANGDRVMTGAAQKVAPRFSYDVKQVSYWCKNPPCNYYSWLYKK